MAFDLINEPPTHAQSGNEPGDVGISLANSFGCAQTSIHAIRAAGHVKRGLQQLDLAPGEPVEMKYVPKNETAGYALGAIQYASGGAARRTVGRHTFVVWRVDGFTLTERPELESTD